MIVATVPNGVEKEMPGAMHSWDPAPMAAELAAFVTSVASPVTRLTRATRPKPSTPPIHGPTLTAWWLPSSGRLTFPRPNRHATSSPVVSARPGTTASSVAVASSTCSRPP